MQQGQSQPLPPPFHHLQQAQQALASAAADYELKRRYLALLPPQQIIEICLTFDVHVPPYIKSTIWPPDLNAAIGTLQRQERSTQGTPQPNGSTSQNDAKKHEIPLMDSLLNELENLGESLSSRADESRSEPPTPAKSPPAAPTTNTVPVVAPTPQPPSQPVSTSSAVSTPAPIPAPVAPAASAP
ncbi:hypothetical protein V5O48_001397, partial [Marasmius crinis-equi]